MRVNDSRLVVVLVDPPGQRVVADHGTFHHDDEVTPVRCDRHRLDPATVEDRWRTDQMRVVR